MRSRPQNPGYTLLEILIALAIIVIIVSVVYGTYQATILASERYQKDMAYSQQGRALLAQMARQIRCCYIQPQNENYVFNGNTTTAGSENLLRLITTCPVISRNNALTGLYEIAYKLNSSGRLYYREIPFHKKPNDSRISDHWFTLAEDISSLALSFSDGDQWHDRWDYQKEHQLPVAVKITLTQADADNRIKSHETIAAIYSSGYVNTEVKEKPSAAEKQ